MESPWKESIYLQREQLGRMLHEPLANLAEQCATVWGSRVQLDSLLTQHVNDVPHCSNLYCLDRTGLQVCDNVSAAGVAFDHYGRDRSQRPYMKEAVPAWGFLLSDAYISQNNHRPSLTALQVVRADEQVLGYVGADFDLRALPATAALYEETGEWRQVKGDPSIRGMVFQQCRVESPMDRTLEQSLSILEELLTQRGVFQCQIHFSSSQATIWTVNDPYRYRILDQEALSDPDICLVYPVQHYPVEAVIPDGAIAHLFDILSTLRMADENIYLRMSSLNLFNGMVSATFSCDGTHYMRYDEFLSKDVSFWLGTAA